MNTPITETAVYHNYTRPMLEKAFNKVENKANWKLPIDTTINSNEREVTQRAIEFYTASTPVFTPIMGTQLIRVQAPGYYNAVGA